MSAVPFLAVSTVRGILEMKVRVDDNLVTVTACSTGCASLRPRLMYIAFV